MKKTPIVLAIASVGVIFAAWTTGALEADVAPRADANPETAAASRADANPETAAAMSAAATSFLSTLTAQQRAEAVFTFADAERTRWHYVPGEMHPRKGLPIKNMSEAQRTAARALLRTGTSQSGYATANAIMDLELILRAIEGAAGTLVRDPELYYFSIFGTPGNTGAWGWRVEGHHLSLRFTVVNGSWVATAPNFMGTNPAEVRQGPQAGLRILAQREDIARQLIKSLDASQKATAKISNAAPDEIVTGPALEVTPLSPVGIPASALRPDQRALLLSLIDVYLSITTEKLATERLAKLQQAGIDQITFAWAGGEERGDRHYYRIQGPTFLVEYDNTQTNANHIHSVWRDFNGDFGRDILREHLAAVAH